MTSYNREKPIKVLDSAGLEQDCIAVVDTLADSSWISRRRLYELGYSKNTSRRGKITKLGDGTLVRSQGTAQLSWRMSNGLLMRDHEFEMLPNNDIDIIFGDDIIRKYDLVVINWENLCPLVTAQEHETPGKLE
ncbi:uncharacterized protein LY89DRAFT_153928 [Mollisia scopiformis]|uniref:Uncharacterized protein n=1 Tax=Mollisia scopiformis TaxID=149040 RepID=A0A194WZP6_MOLSC|nr:uncharacterized protein LY89DRAFT_153928 [Mollisia scopiformis]KUJ13184.1 hypothetical protein LY89DRAFT_153928 [Mollisia scopiformis]